MSSTLRAAIIGAGRIASTYDDEVANPRPPQFFQGEHRHPGLYTVHPVNHAASYRSTPGYELVAVAGRNQERLNAFRDRWQVAAYNDFQQMLADTKPDVVSICTQSAEKAALTVAIARSGAGVKAIIVEKAMATSMAETDAMIAACEDAGILLVVNHPYRFSPMARKAQELIANGDIGPIGTISGWSRGGVIHGGTHTFDLLRFFGGDIAEIVALNEEIDEWADRGVTAMIRFVSGATGFVSLERDAVAGFDIRGATGAITLSTMVGDAWTLRVTPLDPTSARAYPMVAKRESLEGEKHDLSTTQRLLSEVRAELMGGESVISTGRDGAAALEAGIASLISAKEQRAVPLPLAADLRGISIPNR